MQRKALYSRAARTRSATASGLPAVRSGAAGRWEAAASAVEAGQQPPVTAMIGERLRRFAGRHERPLLVAGSVVLSLAAFTGYNLTHPAPRRLTQSDIDGAVHYTLAHTPRAPADSALAAAKIAPSIVEVEGFLSPQHAAALAAKGARPPPSGRGLIPRGAPHRPGGAPAPGPQSQAPAVPKDKAGRPDKQDTQDDQDEPAAIGSGVVVDEKGQVLTALHVLTGTDRWVVVFADGSKSDAQMVGSQPENDLAVLQPAHLPDELQPATLASTAGLAPGDEVVATGFPFGIGPSVSAGVVSGLEREFIDPDNEHVKLKHLIQFDAAANPGNSGGPLVNRDGEVVGIVTAILNPTGAHVFAGIGFAVPIQNAMTAVGENPL